jgi:hypothetical protein
MTPIIFISRRTEGFEITMKRMAREVFSPSIAKLKRSVPPAQRRFDEVTKKWFVEKAAQESLNIWLGYMRGVHGANVEWLKPEREHTPKKPQGSALPDAYAALYLLPNAPPEVVRASYKALAQLVHPDKPGGDVAAMQRLNEAYRQLAA